MRSKKKTYAVVGFICAFILMGYAAQSRVDAAAKRKNDERGGEQTVHVEVKPVKKVKFEDRINVQGNFEARTYAEVSARISGTIEKFFVDEGDGVIAGKTKLFRIDDLKARRSVEIKRQEMAVARCALREREASLEQVEAQLEKVRIDLKRYKSLYEQDAVSMDSYEQQESRYKQMRAARKHAESLVDLAGEQVRQAEIALTISRKDLSDALVYAPITGTVSRRYQEEGEMGTAGRVVLRIEDTSVIEVSAFLPAQYYGRIHQDRTFMKLAVSGENIGTYPVSYKSPTIDNQLRNFEIKSVIDTPPEGVVPGAMAKIEVVLDSHEALGAPFEAVLTRSGKRVVFVAEDNKALMMKVETGMETDGYVEMKGNALTEGDLIVTRGQTFLNDGTSIALKKEAL